MLASVERLKRDIEQYRRDSECDKVVAKHKLAMACVDFEAHLRKGLFVFGELIRLDEDLRTLAFRGHLDYTNDLHDALQALLRWWSEPCDRVLQSLKYFEEQGFKVENAEEFRGACREARGILTPDDQFFSSDALSELRDQAIDSFRRGECEEVET